MPKLTSDWLSINPAWHSPLLGQEYGQSLEDWLAQPSPARAPPAAFPDKQRITCITGGQTMASSKRKMKALVVAKLGDPTASLDAGVLKLEQQHPVPPLPPGSVRVRIVAASLNFADMLQVQGTYQASDSCLQATRLSLPYKHGEACLRRQDGLEALFATCGAEG